MFNKKETLHLLISVLILSIVFGWNDGRSTFNAVLWFSNFLKVFLFVSIAIIVHELAHKIVAHKFDATTNYEIIHLKKIWFQGELKKPLPFWAFISVFLTIISKGQLFFTGIGKTIISSEEKRRIGRKFIYLTGYEEALILLSGPLANVFLVLLVQIFSKALGNTTTDFININLILALWYLIPLPGFDGNGIYFGSRWLYIFGLAFIVLAFVLKFLPFFWTIILSIFLAATVTLFFYWKEEK